MNWCRCKWKLADMIIATIYSAHNLFSLCADGPSWIIFYIACGGAGVAGIVIGAFFVHCCCTRPARRKLIEMYLHAGNSHVASNRVAVDRIQEMRRVEGQHERDGEEDRYDEGTAGRRSFAKERIAKVREHRRSSALEYSPQNYSNTASSPTSNKMFFDAETTLVQSAKSYHSPNFK